VAWLVRTNFSSQYPRHADTPGYGKKKVSRAAGHTGAEQNCRLSISDCRLNCAPLQFPIDNRKSPFRRFAASPLRRFSVSPLRRSAASPLRRFAVSPSPPSPLILHPSSFILPPNPRFPSPPAPPRAKYREHLCTPDTGI